MGASSQIGVRKPLADLYRGPHQLSALRDAGRESGGGGIKVVDCRLEEQQNEDSSPGRRGKKGGRGQPGKHPSEMLIHEGDEDQADVLRMAEEMKIPHPDDVVSELSAKIPALHSKKAPKVLDGGGTLMDLRATQTLLAASFDLIDRELD